MNSICLYFFQKFLRRRKYKLHAAFLNATMITAVDAPVEFEVSIGQFFQKIIEQNISVLKYHGTFLLSARPEYLTY